MDERYYDLCYDAWRSGRNPDSVDPDRYDHFRCQGYEPDEISLRMVLPERPEEPEPDDSDSCA